MRQLINAPDPQIQLRLTPAMSRADAPTIPITQHPEIARVIQHSESKADHTDLEPGVLATARRVLTRLCTEGNIESATSHLRMQQAAAASRVSDLESC